MRQVGAQAIGQIIGRYFDLSQLLIAIVLADLDFRLLWAIGLCLMFIRKTLAE